MKELEEKAAVPAPEDCLQETEFLDFSAPNVQAWLNHKIDRSKALSVQAVQIYYAVRDEWRYNPYTLEHGRDKFQISYVLEKKQSYCIPKALLLAGLCRAVGIPSRLGLGDVRNHISSQRLIDYLQSDVFAFHGFTELYLNDIWVRATPAFDARLCRKFRVDPLEFDGRTDGLFQEFNQSGQRFMEYVRYHGVFADLPYDFIFDSLAQMYPHLFDQPLASGDLYAEGPA